MIKTCVLFRSEAARSRPQKEADTPARVNGEGRTWSFFSLIKRETVFTESMLQGMTLLSDNMGRLPDVFGKFRASVQKLDFSLLHRKQFTDVGDGMI